MTEETMSIRVLAACAAEEIKDVLNGKSDNLSLAKKSLEVLLTIIASANPAEPSCTELSLRDRINIAMALKKRLINDKQFVDDQLALFKVGYDKKEDVFEIMKKVIASSFFDFFDLHPRLVQAYLAQMN